MQRNPLLYSDRGETEEYYEVQEESQKRRPFLFYFIVFANSLLVLFVLGIIWFLFLKSPDFHLKELTDRYFGSSTPQPLSSQQGAVSPAKSETSVLTSQQQDEVQQIRLKQMRQQEELAAEKEQEQARTTPEPAQSKIAPPLTDKQSEDKPETPIGNGSNKTITKRQAESAISAQAPPATDMTTSQKESVTASKQRAIVTNAANEAPTVNSNSAKTQLDQIMEELKQQERKGAQ
ncbi:MAG: hypothetical protein CSB47_04720 [Proteobacteria bacterium]|nr:MAG: hypothetical protein CSB47_04720 [Pseudomonadota bacterium]